jgi:ankyrin repeat protein
LLLVNPTEGLPILEILVQKGADVNVQDKESSTVTHAIARGSGTGSVSLFRFIAMTDAKLNQVDNDGNTPAHIAALARNQETMAFLKEQGVDIETCRNKAGLTPLMLAVKEGQTKLVDSILHMGISPHV